MTRPQIVKEILAEIMRRIDIEDKKVGLYPENKLLGLPQVMRHLHECVWRRFAQRVLNRGSQLLIRLQNQNSALVIIRKVHVPKQCRRNRPRQPHLSLTNAPFSRIAKSFLTKATPKSL